MMVSRPTGRKGYVLCNCDGASCIPVILYMKYGIPMVRGSGLTVKMDDVSRCTGCGRCVSRCIFGAATLADGSPRVDRERCLGCGLCVSGCPAGIRRMERI
jgi:heterodisulfide reductase subunit A-like polyferredoxin